MKSAIFLVTVLFVLTISCKACVFNEGCHCEEFDSKIVCDNKFDLTNKRLDIADPLKISEIVMTGPINQELQNFFDTQLPWVNLMILNR